MGGSSRGKDDYGGSFLPRYQFELNVSHCATYLLSIENLYTVAELLELQRLQNRGPGQEEVGPRY